MYGSENDDSTELAIRFPQLSCYCADNTQPSQALFLIEVY